MIVFATLGPVGSNHELVAKCYFTLNGLDAAASVIFDDALCRRDTGDVDFTVQVDVHSSETETVSAAHPSIFWVDQERRSLDRLSV